ncbi:MAG: class I SAM-dependent methyltransferase [Maribacter sp.]|uniref:class I SAM-dependent methyltransferase n=1 Tax=Maribacter sp. TaxID=1897614 RepID=UPI003296B678
MNCRICGNSESNTAYIGKEMMFGLRDEFDYFQCSRCECLQIADVPDDMSRYYPEQYYSFGSYSGNKFKGFKGRFRRMKYAALVNHQNFFHTIVRFLTGKTDYDLFQGLQVQNSTRILDVGCGNGQSFLYPLAEVGYSNILGCDPYLEDDISYPNGLNIKNSSIHNLSGTWDIITFHHSFEHINDPIENLKKVRQLLAPNGVCIIRIPTVSSFAWQHYKTNWVQFDAPRHFFLHSKKSMQKLAEITNLDFFKTDYDSTHFQFSGSEMYRKDIPLSERRSVGFFNKLRYKKRARKLNKEGNGDQAAFFFKKK